MNSTHYHKTFFVPCYFPPPAWFALIKSTNEVSFVDFIPYIKQTLMNRTAIKGANKIEILTVPVERATTKGTLKDVKICYRQSWFKQHRHAIQSAYGKAAFFEYFADDIWTILFRKPEFLYDLNVEIIHHLLNILESKVLVKNNLSFEFNDWDLLYYKQSQDNSFFHHRPYFQPFGAFQSNLSMLDTLFHLGKDSITYLQL